MPKRENVPQERMATSRQMAEVYGMLIKAVPNLSHAQAQHFIGHQRQVTRQIRTIFAVAELYTNLTRPWEKFYRDVFGVTVDLSGLVIPSERDGFDSLIVVVPGITIERVLTECSKRFTVWRWTKDDLDTVTESVRTAHNGPYAVWVRSTVEADPEHANKSYNDLKAAGINGVTLLERLIMELRHFLGTGKYLDTSNVTLCSGSLYRDGGVPGVDFSGGRVRVLWCGRDLARDRLRAREVVQ